MAIWVDHELCSGCGVCRKVCPYEAVEIIGNKAVITERCIECGACLSSCREKAILTDIEERVPPDFSDRRGIWVFAEQRDSIVNRVSFELLGIGQILANTLGQELSAVYLGDGIDESIGLLGQYGAKNIYIARHSLLRDYSTLAYVSIISEMVREHKPNILLIGATHIGRDLAPRLSRRLRLGLTADCTKLSIDPKDGTLIQTRPAFGGNLMATIVNRYSRPQMATVRPGVINPIKTEVTHEPQKILKTVSLTDADIVTRIVTKSREEKSRFNLKKAKVIVAGGRGVGSAEGMKTLESLASALDGEMAGSRAAVEEGWISADRQIGQTGQTVSPELYFACGISGAIQHRAGILNSRYIIAINKDPKAPIFGLADWGLVGDFSQIVPLLTEKLLQR